MTTVNWVRVIGNGGFAGFTAIAGMTVADTFSLYTAIWVFIIAAGLATFAELKKEGELAMLAAAVLPLTPRA